MKTNKYLSSSLAASILVVSILNCNCSEKPSINSFTVTTHDTVNSRTITADDTLRVNWDVHGKPTLLVHEKQATDSGVRNLEMILVVEKGSKEVNRNISVTIVPKNTATQITISTKRHGDTLVAADIKSPGRWGDRFEILSVSSASRRSLIVMHANKTTVLNEAGTQSNAFEGTPVEGRWELRSLMTTDEKKDSTKAPEMLQINATIQYKRR